MILRTYKSGLSIAADESNIRIIHYPGHIFALDRVFCSNGDQYLATRTSSEGIELMLVNRKTISWKELDGFMSGVDRIERADCFKND